MAQGEDGRRQSHHSLMQLTEKLGILTDQMRTEQTLMVKLAESQMELKPVLTRLAEAASQGGFGADESTRQHIRNIDLYTRRLYDELPASRDQTVSEIRSEIKLRSEEHTSELQSLMRISYAVFCLKQKQQQT